MLRLRQICLVAEKFTECVDNLSNVFGLATCFHDPAVGVYGLQNAILPIGTNFLEIVSPIQEGTAAERYLKRRGGDGGYMIILQCDDLERRRHRMGELGVRIVNCLSYDDFNGIQLDPRDTGGAMLETDQNVGSLAPNGPWHPAGNSWIGAAVMAENPITMVGAELQTTNPKELAERWGKILDCEVRDKKSGYPEIELENALLRFVDVTDGRGEGLGGIDIKVLNRTKILTAARAAGFGFSNGVINGCGMRFKIV